MEVRWNGVSLTGRSWVTRFCYFEMEGRMGNTTKGLTDPPKPWGSVPPGSRPYPHPIPVNSEVDLCPLWNTLPSHCLTWSCLSLHAVPMFCPCRAVSCVLTPQLSVAGACPLSGISQNVGQHWMGCLFSPLVPSPEPGKESPFSPSVFPSAACALWQFLKFV